MSWQRRRSPVREQTPAESGDDTMTSEGQTTRYTVPAELAGERLDIAVAALAEDLSRTAAKRLIDAGNVTVDGECAKPSMPVEEASSIDINVPPPKQLHIEAQHLPLDIVYEDDDLLVVNKPPEMVVYPGPGHARDTLVNALLGHYRRLSAAGGEHRPGLVHRLDQHTSGLVLIARNDVVHRQLAAALERREVKRTYQALVWEVPAQRKGRIVTRFGRHRQHRTLMTVLEEGGREAVTDYQVEEEYAWSWREPGGRERKRRAAYLLCGLQTGRTHQIRVHMAHLGVPLIGDREYGDEGRDQGGPAELNELVRALPGQALHAVQLVFVHPVSGEDISVQAPPAPAFGALQSWLRTQAG